jgi:uncharacterized protein (DUF1330 family)
MSKGYLVAFYSKVQDPEAVAEYAKLAGPAVVANGGLFLGRGGRVKSMEGGIEERSVIIEFDSFDAAVAHYNSADYQEALKVLGDGAVRDMRVIEGID